MDLREWWQATASSYLKSIKKDLILQAVTEGASAEAAHRIQVSKKADLAVAAEQALANTGWLPSFMRGEAWAPVESSVVS
jgi:ParB family chromosome partitioning protein